MGGGVIVFLHAGNGLQSWLKIGVLQSAVFFFFQKSKQTRAQEKYQSQQLKLLRHGRYQALTQKAPIHPQPNGFPSYKVEF